MKKNDDIPVFIKTMIVILVITFVAVCGINIVCMIFPLFNEDINPAIFDVQKSQIDIFIAFLSLTMAITVLVPYFISKKKMEKTVSNFLEKEYKNTLLTRADETVKTDAHLSRMIAFLLLENGYYHWAIGWAFRSLKRYSGLEGDYQKVYKEFHGMIFKEIVLKALKCIEAEKTDSATIKIENLNKDSDITGFFDSKNEEFKIRLRAVKDFLDFEYGIETEKNDPEFIKGLKNNYTPELEKIKTGMMKIFNDLSSSYPDENETNIDSKIKKMICSSSSYENDNDFSLFYDNMKN